MLSETTTLSIVIFCATPEMAKGMVYSFRSTGCLRCLLCLTHQLGSSVAVFRLSYILQSDVSRVFFDWAIGASDQYSCMLEQENGRIL